VVVLVLLLQARRVRGAFVSLFGGKKP
jgi:hypothetical protein